MKKNILFGLISVFLFSVTSNAAGQSTKPTFIDSFYYQGVSVKVPKNVDADKIASLAAKVRPSARQLRLQQYGMLGFVHFLSSSSKCNMK